MPIQDGKYVTPAWQNGGPPAITAEELTAIGQSIVQNQTNIAENTQNIKNINETLQQNSQDIESLQTWKDTASGQISSIQTGYLKKTGGTMAGPLNMGNQRITNLASPSSGTDVVNRNYVDNNFLSQMILVQSETFSATGNTSTSYRFNSAFANIRSSYQVMCITVSGTVSGLGNGFVSILDVQIFYPWNTNSYTISTNNPLVFLFTKHGVDYTKGICYGSFFGGSENLVMVANASGDPSTFSMYTSGITGQTPSANLSIKIYGWNPI